MDRQLSLAARSFYRGLATHQSGERLPRRFVERSETFYGRDLPGQQKLIH